MLFKTNGMNSVLCFISVLFKRALSIGELKFHVDECLEHILIVCDQFLESNEIESRGVGARYFSRVGNCPPTFLLKINIKVYLPT